MAGAATVPAVPSTSLVPPDGPVEGDVIDAGGGGRVDARRVAARGRRRPGHLLRPGRHRAEAGLRRRTGEGGGRQRDRQGCGDLAGGPDDDVARADPDAARSQGDLLARLRVDLEQRPSGQEVPVQARAPLGQRPLAAVGLEVGAALAEDAGRGDQGEGADAQEEAQADPKPQRAQRQTNRPSNAESVCDRPEPVDTRSHGRRPTRATAIRDLRDARPQECAKPPPSSSRRLAGPGCTPSRSPVGGRIRTIPPSTRASRVARSGARGPPRGEDLARTLAPPRGGHPAAWRQVRPPQ